MGLFVRRKTVRVMKIFLFYLASAFAMVAPFVGLYYFTAYVTIGLPEYRAAPVLILSFAITFLVSYISSSSIDEARRRYEHDKRMEKLGY